MRRCRLAILATHPIHYQIALVRRLQQVPGLEVTVLFCSRFGLSRQVDHTFGRSVQWYDESIIEGYPHRFLRNYSWESTPRSIWGTINPGIVRELRRGRYDVLLVQGYAGITEWLAMVSARAAGCRVLFRGEVACPPAQSWSRHLLRRAVLRMLSGAVDLFLPIGTRSQECYRRAGIAEDRLVLAPYAVDNEPLFAEARRWEGQRLALRRGLGIPDGLPVILYVSKLTARKRPLDLLAAFAPCQDQAYLLFVGDGPLKPVIERAAARERIAHVQCVGFQRPGDLGCWYGIGDCFVLPSAYESWGLVVNEAMCFSLPIVTTHGVSSSADLVRSGDNGLLYAPGDQQALREALRALVGDPARRIRMGQQSRARIGAWNLQASVDGVCEGLSRGLP